MAISLLIFMLRISSGASGEAKMAAIKGIIPVMPISVEL